MSGKPALVGGVEDAVRDCGGGGDFIHLFRIRPFGFIVFWDWGGVVVGACEEMAEEGSRVAPSVHGLGYEDASVFDQFTNELITTESAARFFVSGGTIMLKLSLLSRLKKQDAVICGVSILQ